jgi:hypothetical protein
MMFKPIRVGGLNAYQGTQQSNRGQKASTHDLVHSESSKELGAWSLEREVQLHAPWSVLSAKIANVVSIVRCRSATAQCLDEPGKAA